MKLGLINYGICIQVSSFQNKHIVPFKIYETTTEQDNSFEQFLYRKMEMIICNNSKNLHLFSAYFVPDIVLKTVHVFT